MLKKIIALLLFPFAILYGLIARLRNFLFDIDLFKQTAFKIPIIGVGNLNVGGTGKTPHVMSVIEILLSQNLKVAVLSRGYKRKTKGFVMSSESSTVSSIGDEPMEIKNRFPNIKVAVCESRVAGVQALLSQDFALDVIVLDDAYQHRWVKLGLSILLTTYQRPFYNDFIFPMGRLREPRSGKNRADIVIVTKCPEKLSDNEKEVIVRKTRLQQHQQLFFSKINYGKPYGMFNSSEFLDLGNGKFSIYVITGIANPSQLLNYLSDMGHEINALALPDHHDYKISELQGFINKFSSNPTSNKIMLTTEKDATKLKHLEGLKILPIYVLPLSISLDENDKFDRSILNYVGEVR